MMNTLKFYMVFFYWIFAFTIFFEYKTNYNILTSPDCPISPAAKKKRYDTSLCLVTRRLSEMLQSSSDRVVDLNAVAKALSVPKRRLYDVSNVLEGIALARKTSKNHIEWLWVWVVLSSFHFFFNNSSDLKFNLKFLTWNLYKLVVLFCFFCRGTQCGTLSLEIKNLIQEERKLDELIKSCTWQINQMCQNKYTQRYPLTLSSVCPLSLCQPF